MCGALVIEGIEFVIEFNAGHLFCSSCDCSPRCLVALLLLSLYSLSSKSFFFFICLIVFCSCFVLLLFTVFTMFVVDLCYISVLVRWNVELLLYSIFFAYSRQSRRGGERWKLVCWKQKTHQNNLDTILKNISYKSRSLHSLWLSSYTI